VSGNTPHEVGYADAYYCERHVSEAATSRLKKLEIVASAIKRDEYIWFLMAPARHHNVMEMMIKGGEEDAEGVQGFVNERGYFLDRFEALLYARAIGQVTTIIGSVLTSEDLW